MHVAVAGGTGVVGRLVVQALGRAGHEVTVVARSAGVDLMTGQGLREALEPVSVVLDVANAPGSSRKTSVEFFERSTRNLLDAEGRADVRHHVALSIVGCDRVDLGYYLGKRRQEELVRTGDVPWTILRATQFHEFPAQLAERVRGPVLPVPTMMTQPVAAREVAQLLADLAPAEPSGETIELAGPDVHRMPDLARRLLRARGSRRIVVPVRLPGRVGRDLAGGRLLPTDGRRGTQTFDEWLAQQRTSAAR
jgi:uncharacterized protein YbjT (DUF2867 family)